MRVWVWAFCEWIHFVNCKWYVLRVWSLYEAPFNMYNQRMLWLIVVFSFCSLAWYSQKWVFGITIMIWTLLSCAIWKQFLFKDYRTVSVTNMSKEPETGCTVWLLLLNLLVKKKKKRRRKVGMYVCCSCGLLWTGMVLDSGKTLSV